MNCISPCLALHLPAHLTIRLEFLLRMGSLTSAIIILFIKILSTVTNNKKNVQLRRQDIS